MNNTTTSVTNFGLELERRLVAEAEENLAQNTRSKKVGDYSLSTSTNRTKKSSQLKFRDLISTFKIFQPCCFPLMSNLKLSGLGSRRQSTVGSFRSTSITPSTYKIKTCTGKLSQVRPGDKEVTEVVISVKDDIMARLLCHVGMEDLYEAGGRDFDVSLRVVAYKTQVVVGMNYFVKLTVNDSLVCVHCRIYQPIEGHPFLTDVIFNQNFHEDIHYF